MIMRNLKEYLRFKEIINDSTILVDDLYDLLDCMFIKRDDEDLITYNDIKQLYSLLGDEVNDPDYYDNNFANDNDDIVELIFEYALTFGCNRKNLVLDFITFIPYQDERRFESYEEYHSYLINAIIKNCFIRDLYGDSNFLLLEINKIVDESIMITYNQTYKDMLGY